MLLHMLTVNTGTITLNWNFYIKFSGEVNKDFGFLEKHKKITFVKICQNPKNTNYGLQPNNRMGEAETNTAVCRFT